ncbi:MAG: AAA family ATPase [Acidithiobacillus sp.]
MTTRMILIGGLPGSGKTYFGARIASRVGAFLDKDVVTHDFTAALLERLGCPPDDRESPEYINKVRPLEYRAMLSVALKNLEVGHSIICSAPFVNEFYDTGWVQRTEIEAERCGAECHFVWMVSDEDTLHRRIRNRGERRDEWKLNHWDMWYHFVPKSPPAITGLIVMNNQPHAHPSIQQQIVDFLTRLNVEVKI